METSNWKKRKETQMNKKNKNDILKQVKVHNSSRYLIIYFVMLNGLLSFLSYPYCYSYADEIPLPLSHGEMDTANHCR